MARGDLSVSEFANGLRFWVREGTNDHNTAYASAFEDEYALGDVDVTDKLVFDVGAYIGSVGVMLASRGARVVCVEPIPDNARMIRCNAELNGVDVDVVEAAAGASGAKVVRWGFTPDPEWNDHVALDSALGNLHTDQIRESIRHHAFVGSSNRNAPIDQLYEEREVPCYSLWDMVKDYGIPDVVKIDCEGGEWPWLMSVFAKKIPLWVGEWHPWCDDDPEGAGSFKGAARHGSFTYDVLSSILFDSHVVTFTGPEAGPGGFRATLR